MEDKINNLIQRTQNKIKQLDSQQDLDSFAKGYRLCLLDTVEELETLKKQLCDF